MIDKMQQYIQQVSEGNQFLENHDALLNSLLLSKQNARNNFYTDESTQGISDGSQQSSEGIDQPSDESFT